MDVFSCKKKNPKHIANMNIAIIFLDFPENKLVR